MGLPFAAMANEKLMHAGVKGRLHELCSPLARKHEIAVKVVLGRNLEAVVVDNEKTAIDCVEVSHASGPPSPYQLQLNDWQPCLIHSSNPF